MSNNRKALVVGIDYYPNLSNLHGCVNDAVSMAHVLERHFDGRINFDIKPMFANCEGNAVNRADLEDAVEELFSGKGDVALFYFSGHGNTKDQNGYLITSDSTYRGVDGMKMSDVVERASKSNYNNKIIILDCCHSGEAGTETYFNNISTIGEGVTILSACKKDQYSNEINGHGVFTDLLVEALYGGAADVLGYVSPGGVYAYIDRALGSWGQRPVFKTNVESFIKLRETEPSLDAKDLREITKIFKTKDSIYALDPSYEFTDSRFNENNVKIFKLLQKMERVNIVIPDGEEHMYFAAINSKGCKLTALGKHYWEVVNNKYI